MAEPREDRDREPAERHTARAGETAPDAPPPQPAHPLRAQDVAALIAKVTG